jgi:hypothetical protein
MRSRIGRSRRNDDRIFQRAAFFERLHELGNRRTLLANSHIDAVELVLSAPESWIGFWLRMVSSA